MNDGFAWWLVVLGIAIGVGLSWLVLGRLPRAEADIEEDERALEAAWISRAVGDYGGVAPAALVEEILELHEHYLQGPPLELGAHQDDDPDEALAELAPADGADRQRQADRAQLDRAEPDRAEPDPADPEKQSGPAVRTPR